MIGVVDSGWVN